MQQHYDYIITGAGCAGLSLLFRMIQHPFFQQKKILLVDKDAKNANDRTWCFWEKKPGLFEPVIHHRWQQIDFYSNRFSARYDLQPYTYKMIRGIDLYATVLQAAKNQNNIDIITADVQAVAGNENTATVNTGGETVTGSYVFNSIIFENWKELALQQKHVYVLLQHFKGWLIETQENVFDERIATFMDFRINQAKGTAFVYVLPVAANKALVEYTLFSENLLRPAAYDDALKDYIHSVLNLQTYSITHTEYGIIPMTNYAFSKGEGRVINIGTAGGQTKGSTGYTFQFIQKHAAKIINALVQDKNPLHTLAGKRFHFYDSVLLNVLHNKRMQGDVLFAQLFKKNPPQRILKFLDNETNFMEEAKIMNSVSLPAFLPAAIKEIF